VHWLLRDSLMAPEPGEMLGYTKPVDPGFCRGCHVSSGDSHTPDLWRLHKDLDPGHCIECGQLLAASLSGHSSATSGIAAWLRLLTEPRDPQLPRPTDILA